MMAADQRYQYQERYKEYQERYNRYGLDMKPRVEKKQRVKPKESTLKITAQDKIRLVILTFFIGLLCIGLILATSYAANIKFANNELIKENAVIKGEIENLTVKIESGRNIQTVEARAVEEFGMVYPQSDQLIFLEGKEKNVKDFASILKQQAYK